MIAGLEDITDGELRIGDEVVNAVRPEGPRHRDGVPELRALPAHDGAREHGVPAEAREGAGRPRSTQRSSDAARILDLEQHLDRKPANLSGGQRQRVAMGRAIVRDPKAFLMDEPLSNLDAKLRVQMRTEVSRLQKRLGDDDRLRHPRPDRGDDARRPGRGDARRASCSRSVAPAELYDRPANLFVAGFIGSPAMNFMPATSRAARVKLPFGDVRLPDEPARRSATAPAPRRDRRHPPRELRGRLARRRRRATAATFEAKIDLSSRWARSSTPTSPSRPRASSPKQLAELAADAGADRGPRRRARPGRRPPRRRERGRARRGGRALARRREAPPLRPVERREPGGA